MEGEKLIPDWAISSQSLVLKSLLGQDYWELYRCFLLPHDQAVLVPTAHTRAEEHHAHALTQAMAFGHNLSLKCTYWGKEKFSADTKLAQSEASRLVAEEKIKQLETKLEDQAFRSQVKLKTAMAVAMESGKTESFTVGRAAGKEGGLIAGREAYLSSTKHQKLISDTRLEGDPDFLLSPSFQVAIETKASNFLDQGFERCKSQVQKLKGFS
ncbi:hypothetical protein Salat_1140400 [Sesamum alatum]|uniref:Uncharacterized protein n=1 Tax=Sesamum alatum TaxID=300844 RepID=A0AAE1YE36_9LAMI|nr:hypothetical protein Salat_1140400 [Sesamum alatum]